MLRSLAPFSSALPACGSHCCCGRQVEKSRSQDVDDPKSGKAGDGLIRPATGGWLLDFSTPRLLNFLREQSQNVDENKPQGQNVDEDRRGGPCGRPRATKRVFPTKMNERTENVYENKAQGQEVDEDRRGGPYGRPRATTMVVPTKMNERTENVNENKR